MLPSDAWLVGNITLLPLRSTGLAGEWQLLVSFVIQHPAPYMLGECQSLLIFVPSSAKDSWGAGVASPHCRKLIDVLREQIQALLWACFTWLSDIRTKGKEAAGETFQVTRVCVLKKIISLLFILL